MSMFPPQRTTSPQSLPTTERIAASSPVEANPSIQHSANDEDNKQERDVQLPIPTTPPQISPRLLASAECSPRAGAGPIHLALDEEETNTNNTGFRLWPSNGKFTLPASLRPGEIHPEDRSILSDMRRGALIIITTPIAFTGMALYSCGMIIEGVALLLKGVGALGGRFLMRRRQRSQAAQAAEPLWV